MALHLVANGNSNICLIETLDKSGSQVLFASYLWKHDLCFYGNQG